MKQALLLGLSAPAAALNVNRRDALKAPLHRLHNRAADGVAGASRAAGAGFSRRGRELALPKMGIGAWAWGDSLFWGYDKKGGCRAREGLLIRGGRKDGFVDTAELYGIGSESLVGHSRSATAR